MIELNKPVTFLALEWDPGWEFDNPCVLLSPVFHYNPNGIHADDMIEDLTIDFSLDLEEGKIIQDEKGMLIEEFPPSRIKYLKRVARKALNGKEFPLANYIAVEITGTFKKNENGEVEFYENTV